MIYEWNLLRTIACMSIVFLHSTTFVSYYYSLPDVDLYHLLRIILCFATPTFVLLSEIILANKYKHRIPGNFFSTRFKYIFLPFVSFALIDALVTYNFVISDVTFDKFLLNLLGNYEGYFILIILQFYLLHYFVLKFNINMSKFLPISLIIMLIHLYLLNHSTLPFIVENRKYLKLPFTAWIGYFSIAYLIGSNYDILKKRLSQFKWYIISGVVVSLFFIFYFYDLGVTSTHSRRLDLFPFVLSFSLLILYSGSKLKSNSIVNLISNYSLGIYLVHWQVLKIISPYVVDWFGSTLTRVLALFICTSVLSIIVIKLISLLPFGKFIVGKVNRNYSMKNKTEIREAS